MVFYLEKKGRKRKDNCVFWIKARSNGGGKREVSENSGATIFSLNAKFWDLSFSFIKFLGKFIISEITAMTSLPLSEKINFRVEWEVSFQSIQIN